jgi:hypothetical protein
MRTRVAAARMPARRILVASSAVIAIGAGCGDDGQQPAPFAVSPGNVEATWLARVADGPAATAAACGRAAADPVARALCASPAPALGSLTDLYGALGLVQGANARVAVATHSLGLSARIVSALNPRVISFPDYSPLDENRMVAAAFARGEPFVELVGYDAAARDFNYYLLAFQPSCDLGWASGSARAPCAPADLLTERIESGWTGWALYADQDLEDTALDCTSCHRPDGPGAPHRLLMRQLDGPWMHWGDFRGVSAPLTCTDASGAIVQTTGQVSADGADLLREVDGPDGRHAGIPVADLIAAPSGYDLSSFLFYAAALANGTGDVPCAVPDCPFSEPAPFSSQDVLCDRLLDGRGDAPGGAWATYRAGARARGFPVPYFDPDVLAAATRARVAGDFAAFVTAAATPAPGAESADAFSALSGLVGADVGGAIGFLPDADASAEDLLGEMCGRCHGAGTEARLARSRFDAQALGALDAATAAKIADRISLPRTSPDRMPPLRAGELPDWAITRITDFLGMAVP